MSAIDETDSSILRRLPAELWTKILSEKQGFEPMDLRTLCLVAPLFRNICRPLVYRNLAARNVKIFYGKWNGLESSEDMGQWKKEMMSVVRAERRLFLIGSDPTLSTFPQTMSIDVHGTPNSAPPRPPGDKMVLAKPAYNAFLRFKCTLVQTLPSFSRLRRLGLSSLPIDEAVLGAIASLPLLCELRFRACSFPSPTFPMPSIRLLECNQISREHSPAAIRLAPPVHLEELRIENIDPSVIVTELEARSRAESVFTKLQHLTIHPGSFSLSFSDMESLLGYVPALLQLDIIYNRPGEHRTILSVPSGSQALNLSMIPHLRRLSSPLTFTRYIVPGRPVNEIKMDHSGNHGDTSYVSTWPELQALFSPLCLSSATADGITTLHLPHRVIAPIWLLSRFVTETFPNVLDLRLSVGTIEGDGDEGDGRCCERGAWLMARRLAKEKPVKDEGIDGIVEKLWASVEYELVKEFDGDPGQTTPEPIRRVQPIVDSPKRCFSEADIASTLVEFGSDVELDDTGKPSRHPKNYKEALLYLARGWYPLPVALQTLSLQAGLFPPEDEDDFLFGSPNDFLEHGQYVAVATALGLVGQGVGKQDGMLPEVVVFVTTGVPG